ncbi:transglutaminase-like predicted protease domain fused ChW-repeats and cell-adhesion domain [Lachnospiraceae bacterium KM106-2]|nr:transglutaminase-like predicted protease domain fused ChW-repeats and cell-adhesion domain [Lachnospiraceae bacterium KM106-2]
MQVQAAEIKNSLNFYGLKGDTSGEGYDWKEATHTLTLNGFYMQAGKDTDEPNGITLPGDSTIVLKEGSYNYIRSCAYYAIDAIRYNKTDTLTIKGGGRLDLQDCQGGIYTEGSLKIDSVTIQAFCVDYLIQAFRGEKTTNHQVEIANSTVNAMGGYTGISTMGGYQYKATDIGESICETNVIIDHSKLDFYLGVNDFNTADKYHAMIIRNGRLTVKQSKLDFNCVEPAIVVWKQYRQQDSTESLISIDESGTDYFLKDEYEIQAREKNILGANYRLETSVLKGSSFDFDFDHNKMTESGSSDTFETLSFIYGHNVTGASDDFSTGEYSDERINFDSRGGSSVQAISYRQLYHQNSLPVTTKAGAVFAGWSMDGTQNTKVELEAIIKRQQPMTLYALWNTKVQDGVCQETTSPATSPVPTNTPVPVEKKVWTKIGGFKQSGYSFNKIKLSFQKKTGASSYILFYYDRSAKKYCKVTTIKAKNQSVTIKKIRTAKGKTQAITSNKQYKFKLIGIKKVNGKEQQSAPAYVTAYTCPKSVKLSVKQSKNKKQLMISWRKTSANGYRINIKQNGKTGQKTIMVSSKMKSYRYKVNKKKKYFITIKPYKKVGKKIIYGNGSTVKN